MPEVSFRIKVKATGRQGLLSSAFWVGFSPMQVFEGPAGAVRGSSHRKTEMVGIVKTVQRPFLALTERSHLS